LGLFISPGAKELELQGGTLKRRVVHLIKDRLHPNEIYQLITQREVRYSPADQEANACRDRAVMALGVASAGRITEIVGGPVFKWDKEKKKAFKVQGKRHPGLQVENLSILPERILVSNMAVVKRSQKMIDKYGIQITTRDPFAIPLKRDLYDNPFWDQLVPFGWLIYEYLVRFAPKSGKLFPFEDTRAYQIIREVTGNYPHWFRAQAEHFYGHFLLTDSVKLAKFLNLLDPKHTKHYIGYDWTAQLKDKLMSMDFAWIDSATRDIQQRMEPVRPNFEAEHIERAGRAISNAHIDRSIFTQEEWAAHLQKIKTYIETKAVFVVDAWSWSEGWLTEWFKTNYKLVGFDDVAEQFSCKYNELKAQKGIGLFPDFMGERKGIWLSVELECFSEEYKHHPSDYADVVVCYDESGPINKEVLSLRKMLNVKEVILSREIPEFLYLYDQDFRTQYDTRMQMRQLEMRRQAEEIWK